MLPVFAVLPMFLLSSAGFAMNVHLFSKFSSKLHESSEFTKLCLAKTVPNILVCGAFLFWSVPLSTLNIFLHQIPLPLNVLIGQLIGYGAYVSGPIIQMFMALNRCFLICFPFRKLPVHGSSVTMIALSLMFMVASVYTIRGLLPVSCGFYYEPQQFLWQSNETECPLQMETLVSLTVIGLSITSNSLNFLTLLKLCYEKVGGLSNEAMVVRRKRRVRLFIQSVCQDCLHLIDIINWKFIAYMRSDTWFLFIFVTMSLLAIHALDGFVMFYFHSELHPKFMKKSRSTPITLTG